MSTSRKLPDKTQYAPRGSRHDGRVGVRSGVAQSGGAVSPGATQAEARLLVVEDDPNIRELLSASLRFAGFAVDAVTTGSEAVTAAR